MGTPAIPASLLLEIVTPERLLLKEQVDSVVAPGVLGSFGVLPGHTPFFTTLGSGEIAYRRGKEERHLTCFWGFCEVLPDRVTILADLGERAEDIDLGRAEEAKTHAAQQMASIRDEAGFKEAQLAYIKAVTRIAVARRHRE
jgi:F-type H+-transporting ATPase subunit epsilon